MRCPYLRSLPARSARSYCELISLDLQHEIFLFIQFFIACSENKDEFQTQKPNALDAFSIRSAFQEIDQ